MGNKKYFFFDYDGTLAVPRTRSIPQSTLEALMNCERRGISCFGYWTIAGEMQVD